MYTGKLLPKAIDLRWTGGLGFSTNLAIMANAKESRNQEWAGGRSEYVISYNARNARIWSNLRVFMGLHAGMAHSFRLIDPVDNTVDASEGRFQIIDATTAQMVKRYTFEDLAYDVVVTKPGAATLNGGSGASFQEDTGIVTYATIPDSWESPEYYKHVRFDVDRADLSGISRKGGGDKTLIAGYHDIPIVEVLYDDEEDLS